MLPFDAPHINISLLICLLCAPLSPLIWAIRVVASSVLALPHSTFHFAKPENPRKIKVKAHWQSLNLTFPPWIRLDCPSLQQRSFLSHKMKRSATGLWFNCILSFNLSLVGYENSEKMWNMLRYRSNTNTFWCLISWPWYKNQSNLPQNKPHSDNVQPNEQYWKFLYISNPGQKLHSISTSIYPPYPPPMCGKCNQFVTKRLNAFAFSMETWRSLLTNVGSSQTLGQKTKCIFGTESNWSLLSLPFRNQNWQVICFAQV